MKIAYVKRTIEQTLKQAAAQFPALILTGPRQSGKTTLLKHLFHASHGYVTLDDPEARLQANEDPRFFLKNYPPPVMIDEIQYAPGLLPYLKIDIDEHRSQKGRFLLTGSQIFPLMKGVSESLAGRIAVLSLLSFSSKEAPPTIKKNDLEGLKQKLLAGGYPEVVLSKPANRKLWFSGYLQTYLERDIRQLRQVGSLTDFQRFLEMLAAFNGQALSLSSLSRDLGLAVNTIKSWVSVLAATHQILLIPPFYRNRGKRLIKSPKVYFLDTGFLCYLLGITGKDQVLNGIQAGPLLETFVLGELVRAFYGRGEVPRIYWWRTSYGQEVDFIVENQGKLIPIEVKLGTKQNKALIKNLIAFKNLFSGEVACAYLVNLTDQKTALAEKISAFPLKAFIQNPPV